MKKLIIGMCLVFAATFVMAKSSTAGDKVVQKKELDKAARMVQKLDEKVTASQKKQNPKYPGTPKATPERPLAAQTFAPEYPKYPEYPQDPEYPKYPQGPKYPKYPEYPTVPKVDSTIAPQGEVDDFPQTQPLAPKMEYPQDPEYPEYPKGEVAQGKEPQKAESVGLAPLTGKKQPFSKTGKKSS